MNVPNANLKSSFISNAPRVLTMLHNKVIQTGNDEPNQAVIKLTEEIIAGNREALATLYHNYFRFIFNEAKRAGCTDESLCLDIVHEVMLRIMHSMRIPFQYEPSLINWIRRITYSVTYDHYRKETSRKSRENKKYQSSQTTDQDEITNTPSQTRDKQEQLNWLRIKIAELDDHQSTLIVLRYRFNWTLDKIAKSLGLSTGAVDGRINRILAKIRKDGCEDTHE